MEREYVILCNEHSGLFRGAALFWGHKTEDNEKRSFGGYTSDIDGCEMYTLEEIKNNGYNFPVFHRDSFGEKDDEEVWWSIRQISDIIIKKEDLLNFKNLKTIRVLYRP